MISFYVFTLRAAHASSFLFSLSFSPLKPLNLWMHVKAFVLSFVILAVSDDLLSQNIIKEPEPSGKPGAYQLAQIKRKYGMFIHFGINTFFDEYAS